MPSVSVEVKKIAVIGHPNVGKSVLFNDLTGRYATVSNYPGTTVEVTRGETVIGGFPCEIIDTPGLYSFSPLTEEEAVARRIILGESPSLVVHVVDAKGLERMLPLTLALLEAGLAVVLVLNMMDEARAAGIEIDRAALEEELGVPVVETVSTTGEGVEDLRQILARETQPGGQRRGSWTEHHPEIESFVREAEAQLDPDYGLTARAAALLVAGGDVEIGKALEERQPATAAFLAGRMEALQQRIGAPEIEIAVAYRDRAAALARRALRERPAADKKTWGEKFREGLSEWTTHPLTGFPILCLILYWGFYQFVGVFGAGTVVDVLETHLFEERLNPLFQRSFEFLIPSELWRGLFVGEYGVLTLGLRYAVAIIMPIVSFFFLIFAVIEDSGYLPRLALLIDRLFKGIGLSGRAVIPMVLGFGCDTMATMVTRTLPTVRERVISTILLALAIPCSAQLGVILALLSGHPKALAVWAGTVAGVFLLIGFLSAQLIPGEKPVFYMELPPLRLPKASNVLLKTWVRLKWYFHEILPLFIAASALIWLGEVTGVFSVLIRLLAGPVQWIGLPPETAPVVLLGFFRRDYGAAGLYDLAKQNLLTPAQLVVACVALTLFLPCIAQFLMNVKERGWRAGLGISALTLAVSFGVAYALNQLLNRTGLFS
ncbi:MAG: ferrous iron transport protein B [Candidatus Omnitrophica bacterium]|nr:ferrous iron transport protein B [Candidatus Omnitrophota bacterium]